MEHVGNDMISEGTEQKVFLSEFHSFNGAERRTGGRIGLPLGIFLISLVFMAVFVSSLVIAEDATDDLDYWMSRAKPTAETQPASSPAIARPSPLRDVSRKHRADALPGVIELSDGTRLAGWMYGTRDKPWMVWVAEEKRWRRIPPAAVLSITAVVDREEMQLRWRWKATGQPEKVYTGKSYPFRRFRWRFRLADGSEITGVVKGQPIWVEVHTKTQGPFLLQERSKGQDGQTLAEFVYIRKIVVSRRLMEAVCVPRAKKGG